MSELGQKIKVILDEYFSEEIPFTYEFMLNKAMLVASIAHRHQADKGGMPYVEHLLSVAFRLGKWNPTKVVIALLHDIVEDTEITADELSEMGFRFHIVEAVMLLSKKDNTTLDEYREYIHRISENTLARAVKIADLEHNLYLQRINRGITEFDLARVNKYIEALHYLNKREENKIT